MKPIDLKQKPSYELCLHTLLRIEKLLLQQGPGVRKRKSQVMGMLEEINDYEVMTHNMLNPAAGEFPIAARDKDTCVDPSTERYHAM